MNAVKNPGSVNVACAIARAAPWWLRSPRLFLRA
jgi:hypothetical protein